LRTSKAKTRAKSKPRNPIGFYPTPQPPRGRKDKSEEQGQRLKECLTGGKPAVGQLSPF